MRVRLEVRIKLFVETIYQLEEYEGMVVCSVKCRLDEDNCFSKEMSRHPKERLCCKADNYPINGFQRRK